MFAFFKRPKDDEIVVREARADDARGIVNVMNSVGKEKEFTVTEDFSWFEEDERNFIKRLDKSKDLIVVTSQDREIIGYLTLFRYYGGKSPKVQHVGEIGICIKKEHRDMGIGTRMLEYSFSWARKHGYKKLCLSVFSTNSRAIHLYKKLGFQEEGIRKKQFLVGDEYVDEIMMGKFL